MISNPFGCRSQLTFRRHYWVIDALDECSAAERRNYDILFSMLSKIDDRISLKIFMTSRPSSELERLLSPLPVISEQITVEDSQHDIRLYVNSNADGLPVEDEETRQELIEKIVDKSSGCFLWTVLVMQQLQDVYSLEETEQVLEEVPQEMERLYYRNLCIMSGNSRTKRLAMTVLRWAVCATRPLSLNELKDAIKLDIDDTVTRDLGGSISSLCGQLVYVDKNSLLQVVHQTARAFLLDPALDSEFRVDSPAANLQLGQACLKYLTSDEMALTTKRKRVEPMALESSRNMLADYACNAFSEHVSRASSTSDVLYKQLALFSRTNVLSWVQRLAETRDLTALMRTGKHLKACLLRSVIYIPTLQDEIEFWAIDLPRIVTEFGTNLLHTPSAIHTLVAPFCPRNSMIYRRFSAASNSMSNGLRLEGLLYPDWHDRISCIYYRESAPKAAACKDHVFAIGLLNGNIEIYRTSTCEHIRRMWHGERVHILRFGNTARKLASAGFQSIKLWDTSSGSCLLDIAMKNDLMALAFNEDGNSLTAATRSREVITWHADNAIEASRYVWNDRLIERTPSHVVISMEHKLIAMTYRGLPVSLWCMETRQFLGACLRSPSKRDDSFLGINAVVFSTNPDVELLAVAYWDEELALYDTLRRDVKHSITSNTQLEKLAVSPDGRTLIGGSIAGNVQLFDFETLQLLYDITVSEDRVAALAFSSDNLRFLDLRGSRVNVWEPSVLVRKDVDDKKSDPSDAAVPTAVASRVKPYEDMCIITALVAFSDGTAAISGRNNGAVDVHDLLIPDKPAQELYRHEFFSFTKVSLLAYLDNKQILVSVDNSNKFRVVELSHNKSKQVWAVKSQILQAQLQSEDYITQALFSSDGTRLLLSTSRSDVVWSLTTKQIVASNQYLEARRAWKWYTDQRTAEEIVLLHSSFLRRHAWATLAQLTDPLVIDKGYGGDNKNLKVEEILADSENEFLILNCITSSSKIQPVTPRNASNQTVTSQIFSLCLPPTMTTSNHRPQRLTLEPCFSPEFTANNSAVDIVIGILKNDFDLYSLLFLCENGWVCSVQLGPRSSEAQDSFRRHFFVPLAWLSTSEKLIVRVTERKDVIFVRGEELAVVKNGL